RGVTPQEATPGAKVLFTRDGTSGEPDFTTALKWARRAAEGGSAEGQAALGYILTSGPETIRNESEAERWYARSAQAGCPQGCLGFGLALLRRAQDQRTQTQAAEQIAKASAAGIPTALYLAGSLREFGIG